jgi:hypothetical protein
MSRGCHLIRFRAYEVAGGAEKVPFDDIQPAE